jgi:microcystin-dependent protein
MSDPYLGEIRMLGLNFQIAGWAFCDGSLLAISENDALFQLIGTEYGGDGQSTFALPNLQCRIPMHQGNGFLMAETGGTEQETLTVNQIPVHSHPMLASRDLASQPTPGGNLPAQSGTINLFIDDTPTTALAAQNLSPAGGSQPHDNLHPYLTITFQISLFGEFPSPT